MTINIAYNMDCVEAMRKMPDKAFDLAIVDPPYGINASKGTWGSSNKGKVTNYGKKDWDKQPPTDEYFVELRRVSKNQIIWGGNYFDLPPSQGFIIWDKKQPQDFSSAMCEMAWMSFQKPAKIFRKHVVTAEPNKIHPTQKPVTLYRWILQRYAKPGQLILDTHSGSGSLACACHIEKFDFIAIEKDPHYHALSVKRLDELRSQGVLF